MLSLRRPDTESIRRFLGEQAKLDFTYAEIGATAVIPPPGYVVDHMRVKLGNSEQTYKAAKTALQQWDQFRLDWLEAIPQEQRIQPGAGIAILARVGGFWWLNACRIIFVIDETGARHRFGFAYGTLPDHAGSGEERFLIEWDQQNDDVWYDILAFSRPHHLLARLGYPFVRRTQQRFGRESSEAMVRLVSSSAVTQLTADQRTDNN